MGFAFSDVSVLHNDASVLSPPACVPGATLFPYNVILLHNQGLAPWTNGMDSVIHHAPELLVCHVRIYGPFLLPCSQKDPELVFVKGCPGKFLGSFAGHVLVIEEDPLLVFIGHTFPHVALPQQWFLCLWIIDVAIDVHVKLAIVDQVGQSATFIWVVEHPCDKGPLLVLFLNALILYLYSAQHVCLCLRVWSSHHECSNRGYEC